MSIKVLGCNLSIGAGIKRSSAIGCSALLTLVLVGTNASSGRAAVRGYATRPGATVPYASATYGIKDVGAPPSGYRSFTQPLGFNATGQIVGEAYPASPPASNYQHCIARTASTWVDIGGPQSLNCWATAGISDANAAGVFHTVGGTDIPTSNQEVAFYATVGPTTATQTVFAANSPSELWTMNASGVAAGNGVYYPYNGFASNSPPFTSTGTTLTLLQPNCTTAAVTYCMQYPYYYASQSGESRSIAADGTVFGYAVNAAHGQFVESNGGAHPTAYQFSLPLDAGNGPFNERGIDDKGDVVYEEFNPTLKIYQTWTFIRATRKANDLGSLPGNSCTQYTPLYINGPGRVLGYTQACSFPSDQTYWTWDATNGMVAVSFSHTGYSAINLYLINDKGQIAGDFVTATGVHHWGYLIPPGKL